MFRTDWHPNSPITVTVKRYAKFSTVSFHQDSDHYASAPISIFLHVSDPEIAVWESLAEQLAAARNSLCTRCGGAKADTQYCSDEACPQMENL